MWVGCWWCTLDISPEHYAQCGICCWSWWVTAALWKETLRWDLPLGKHGCCRETSCHPPLLAFRWIIHIFTNSYELRVPPRFLLGSQFSSCPYIPPNPSLPPSLPFGADALLFLYPRTCFTHTHTCSPSLTELHFGLEREELMKRNRSFFNRTLLWSHLFTLIFSVPTSYFASRNNFISAIVADVPLMHFKHNYRLKKPHELLYHLVVVFFSN